MCSKSERWELKCILSRAENHNENTWTVIYNKSLLRYLTPKLLWLHCTNGTWIQRENGAYVIKKHFCISVPIYALYCSRRSQWLRTWAQTGAFSHFANAASEWLCFVSLHTYFTLTLQSTYVHMENSILLPLVPTVAPTHCTSPQEYNPLVLPYFTILHTFIMTHVCVGYVLAVYDSTSLVRIGLVSQELFWTANVTLIWVGYVHVDGIILRATTLLYTIPRSSHITSHQPHRHRKGICISTMTYTAVTALNTIIVSSTKGWQMMGFLESHNNTDH